MGGEVRRETGKGKRGDESGRGRGRAAKDALVQSESEKGSREPGESRGVDLG